MLKHGSVISGCGMPKCYHAQVPRPCDLGSEDRVHARDLVGCCKTSPSNPSLGVTRQSHMVLAGLA